MIVHIETRIHCNNVMNILVWKIYKNTMKSNCCLTISKAPWGVPDLSGTPPGNFHKLPRAQDICWETLRDQHTKGSPRPPQTPQMTPNKRNLAPLAPSLQPPSTSRIGRIAKRIQYIYLYITCTFDIYYIYIYIYTLYIYIYICIYTYVCQYKNR